jgi:hypothetical protein
MNNYVDRRDLPTWPPEKEIVEYNPDLVIKANNANSTGALAAKVYSTSLIPTNALAISNGPSYPYSESNASEGGIGVSLAGTPNSLSFTFPGQI